MSEPTTAILLNRTAPAAPTGDQNVVFQSDDATPQQSISAYPKRMVGDSGSGGTAGTVPPPGSGDAAAGKFLKADGTWEVPSSFADNEILIVTSGPTIPALAHTPNPASSLKLYWQGARQRYATDFTLSGTAITPVTFTPSVGDNLIADYRY
ncbi:hypothetical protein GCM10011507_33460 [Edaphobacter acidisoli]|uniref:Uncharacterized protein n=1 Tax=Edaphobacter acidisoli TaxID=2040573 RepID=A0A916W9P0_9BACT|nr:hypothetical protein [Edaphobacter acidisoli]GGA79537.1 hypothetical protein GCM10011507_33460 [Edaphobacter acidisoli]